MVIIHKYVRPFVGCSISIEVTPRAPAFHQCSSQSICGNIFTEYRLDQKIYVVRGWIASFQVCDRGTELSYISGSVIIAVVIMALKEEMVTCAESDLDRDGKVLLYLSVVVDLV